MFVHLWIRVSNCLGPFLYFTYISLKRLLTYLNYCVSVLRMMNMVGIRTYRFMWTPYQLFHILFGNYGKPNLSIYEVLSFPIFMTLSEMRNGEASGRLRTGHY